MLFRCSYTNICIVWRIRFKLQFTSVCWPACGLFESGPRLSMHDAISLAVVANIFDVIKLVGQSAKSQMHKRLHTIYPSTLNITGDISCLPLVSERAPPKFSLLAFV